MRHEHAILRIQTTSRRRGAETASPAGPSCKGGMAGLSFPKSWRSCPLASCSSQRPCSEPGPKAAYALRPGLRPRMTLPGTSQPLSHRANGSPRGRWLAGIMIGTWTGVALLALATAWLTGAATPLAELPWGTLVETETASLALWAGATPGALWVARQLMPEDPRRRAASLAVQLGAGLVFVLGAAVMERWVVAILVAPEQLPVAHAVLPRF